MANDSLTQAVERLGNVELTEERLSFIASLASLRWLEDESFFSREEHRADLRRLFGDLLLLLSSDPKPTDEEIDSVLFTMHRICHRVLVPLVDNEQVEAAALLKELQNHPDNQWYATVRDRRVVLSPLFGGGIRGVGPQTSWIWSLFRSLVLPGVPFRFSRCPECRQVFVPEKNQRFCSPNCQVAANREHRREYMREALRQRRLKTKGKKRSRKKGGAT